MTGSCTACLTFWESNSLQGSPAQQVCLLSCSLSRHTWSVHTAEQEASITDEAAGSADAGAAADAAAEA